MILNAEKGQASETNELEEIEEQGRNEQDSMDYDALASVVDQIVQTATAQKQKPATAEQEEKQTTSKEALTDSIDEELLCQEAEKIEKAAAQKKRDVQTEEKQTTQPDVHTIERNVKKNKRPPTTKDETFIYETPEQIKKKIKKKDPKEKAKSTETHNLQLNDVRCDKKTWTELDEQTAEKIKQFFDTVETNE